MNKNETRTSILELCSESEHGSWEFWSTRENKTQEEANEIVRIISDLVTEGKIFPIEYQTVKNQTYQKVPLDIDRLKNEIDLSMKSNVNPENSYWFLATKEGEEEDIAIRSS